MKKNVPRTLIIKKYENRRLYNTLTSQYINQDQVAQLVRDGYEVGVVDAATGEDITRVILAQIVLEDAKTPESVFPLDVLRQMIVASGQATQEGALRYMKAMLDMYQTAYRALPSPLNPFEFMPGRWTQAPAPAGMSQPGVVPGGFSQPRDDQTGASGREAGEMGELKKRIAELESALAKRAPREKARRAQKTKSRRKA